jgi:WD40 repeat protein
VNQSTRVGPAALDSAAGGSGYDVFMSYSHSADALAAPVLQRLVRRVGRAWYRPSSLRIFRDRTSLPMSESLWGSIEAAMSRSSSFVLMASPGAATSPWVGREVQYWRRSRETSSFHIVLTDGEIAWDRERGDFDWNRTTALPPDLAGWFADEPHWLDVRQPHGISTHVDQRNSRLRDAARTIAAPLYGLDKDQLDGEDEREARRARRTLRLGIVTLAILTVIALLAAGVAYRQYVATRDEERLAIARLLLPQADALLSTDPQKALQINEAAARIHPDQETRAGLLRNLTKSRYAGTLTGHTDTVYTLAYSPDGRTLATSSRDNHVNLWDVADGNLPTQPVGQVTGGAEYGPLSLSFAPDGRTLAGGGFGEVALWDTSDPAHPRSKGTLITGRTDDPASVLYTAGGVLVAWVDDEVMLYDDIAGSPQALADPLGSTEFVNTVSVDARGTTLVMSGATSASIWDIDDPRHPRRLGQFSVPAAPQASALSPDGRLFVTSAGWDGTTIAVWDLADPGSPHRLDTVLTGNTLRVNAIAFSPDGRTVATGGDDGSTRLWDLGDPVHAQQIGEPLVAPQGFVNDLAFAPTGTSLATAGENGTAVLWNPGPRVRPHAKAEERGTSAHRNPRSRRRPAPARSMSPVRTTEPHSPPRTRAVWSASGTPRNRTVPARSARRLGRTGPTPRQDRWTSGTWPSPRPGAHSPSRTTRAPPRCGTSPTGPAPCRSARRRWTNRSTRSTSPSHRAAICWPSSTSRRRRSCGTSPTRAARTGSDECSTAVLSDRNTSRSRPTAPP